MGGHYQENKRNLKKKQDSSGWIGTLTRKTLQLKLTRLDWDINAGRTRNKPRETLTGWIVVSTQSRQLRYTTLAGQIQAGAANHLFLQLKSPPRCSPKPKEKTKKTDSPAPNRPPPCGTRRRRAATTVPTPRQSETTESGPLASCLADASAKTQCAGASPRPPSDSSSLSSPRRRHHTRGPRHVRLSTPCHGFVYCITVRKMNSVALFPRSSLNSRNAPVGRQQHVAPHTHVASATVKANQNCRLRHLPTMNHAGVTPA